MPIFREREVDGSKRYRIRPLWTIILALSLIGVAAVVVPAVYPQTIRFGNVKIHVACRDWSSLDLPNFPPQGLFYQHQDVSSLNAKLAASEFRSIRIGNIVYFVEISWYH